MVLAALKTYKMGNKSMDYMLKRYGNRWAENFEIGCSRCERKVWFKSEFGLSENDFIVECYRCGKFFCNNCLDLENAVSDEKDESLQLYCVECSKKVKKRGTSKSKSVQKGKAKIIYIDKLRRRKHE
jgi:hypothetical protein